MAVAAGWHSDPSGSHELRYWDGTTWTTHVSDHGSTSTSPLPSDAPLPPPAPSVPPPPPAAPAAKSGSSWMNKMKAAATQAADQGKAMVDQAKGQATEQAASRRAQYENDPNTLWMGEGGNTAARKTGMGTTFYRLTKDRLWIESGMLGSKSENVPLWAVKDVDVRQSMFQSGGEVGDVVLILEDASLANNNAGLFNTGNFSGSPTTGAGTGQVVIDNIEGPHKLRDLLMPLISDARQAKVMERNSQYIHYATPPTAPAAPAPTPEATASPEVDISDQLRKLASLRDDGILTDEEFAAQKAKLLG
ncbi:MAG: SHOCT domain-containing protein [Candidatus Nanopelagicales bacterium]